MPTHRIAVVAFNRISPFHLAVPCAVFGDNPEELPPIDFRVCAAEPSPLTTSAGFSIATRQGLSALRQADTIIVPSWRDPQERPPEALLQALVTAHRRGAMIVGLCLGAYVLAEAGLLAGKKATTHWAFAVDFARRYPTVSVHADVLYVEDEGLLTSAGTAAGIDCCLYLVRQRWGAEAANRIARRLVMPPHRQGGQAQYVEQPVPTSAKDARMAELMDWVRENLDQAHTLDSLADRAAMSRRTFTRHFRQLTGMTVGEWLLAERLALGQRLLETTDHSVDAIADLAGLGTSASLRQHFRATFGVSPTAWRQTFRL